MKTHKKIGRKTFLISILSFLLSAVSVFLLPMVKGKEDGSLTSIEILIGSLFWLGIILGVFLFYLTWRFIRNDSQYIELKKEHKPAVWAFFSTRFGRIVDIAFLLSVFLVVVSNITKSMPDLVVLISMFFMLYSFCLHFMLNGRVYKYLFLIRKKKEGEKE